MSREFTVVVERDEDGYFVATVPALRGCHTQARTRDELDRRIREAIEVCVESEQEPPEPRELVAVERVKVQV